MSGGPIKEALQSLSRHADVVEHALMGGVVSQEDFTKGAVQALRQASALRAAGEEHWRLHPRLREYLQDHLQMFPQFQSLTDVSSKLLLLQHLASDAQTAVAERDFESLEFQLASMETAVYDIADTTDRNLTFLASMVSTKYGNVRTLVAKMAQNRWYLRQAGLLSDDLNRLGRIATHTEKEAEERGWAVAKQIRRVVLARMQIWQHGLSDIQTQIRREIFRTRQIEVDLRNLARADQFLSQQPVWRGIDRDFESIPDALLRAVLPRLTPHVEPADGDRSMRQEMQDMVSALPPKKVRFEAEPPKPLQVRHDSQAEEGETPAMAPAALALLELKRVVVKSQNQVSVLAWRDSHEAAKAMVAGNWVFFATTALEAGPHRIDGRDVDFEVELVPNPPEPGRKFATTFRDARVRLAAAERVGQMPGARMAVKP